MNRDYIRREQYLDKISPYIDKDVIKVITGQRRVGKSCLLFQIMDIIRSRNPDVRMVYVNKELHEFCDIKTDRDLVAHVNEKVDPEGRASLFIDEIQEIDAFERGIRSLHAEGRFDIYCTGSNANMLSGELATLLGGRYVEIRVFGLSWPEFLRFHELADSPDAFLKYLRYGGLPWLRHLPLEDDVVYEYLMNIYHTILFKDVVSRHRIRHVAFLERLVEFLADNTGNLVSAKKISDFLKSQNMRMSPNIVLNYLSHLTAAFFVFKARRSDITGKKIFEIGEKYYFEDLGLRHAIIGYSHRDIGKILENVVFIHLAGAGYRVTVGRLNAREVDFVCDRRGRRLYVQVAYLIPDERAHEREFGNLLTIPDNHPKFVVSMDEVPDGESFRGIEHVHVRTFLRRHPNY